MHSNTRSADKLTLAETYALCRDLFGERGKGFDDWKGGFAFPVAGGFRGDPRPAGGASTHARLLRVRLGWVVNRLRSGLDS